MQLKWRLSHARGYLSLGMVSEAEAELSQIPAEEASTIDVLALRAVLLQEQKKWQPMRQVAAELVKLQPEDAGWWIMWAYAARRAESLAVAEKILREAEVAHPSDATIQFNLGCYACQRGDLVSARLHVDQAIALDERFRETATTDSDLAPLREASATR
jgi:Tfp pilus assembly protein PilF